MITIVVMITMIVIGTVPLGIAMFLIALLRLTTIVGIPILLITIVVLIARPVGITILLISIQVITRVPRVTILL